ncbi:efflux RND transporter periplasmic adaptor subunit [Melittangium boletus]|uniref:Hemolysin D n=1 Tax=Melittangium boletus DSM 14713 TaxID=1294270 RepID=A0A250II29_9BACT|nr:efflux RND transporter periplasmic adaptor subunit [Melittangium boletus]ATB30821.1 hemolysin D [Melittangium boletus DSM 14713]
MRLVRRGVCGVWLTVVALAGCHASDDKAKPQQGGAATQQGPGGPGGPGGGKPQQVEVLELAPGEVRDVGEYLGTLISRSSITLYPQVNGYVQRIAVRPGEQVQKGQLLLEVDPRLGRAGVQSAQAQRSSALAQREFARGTRQRAEQLLREGLMSRQDYEQAVSQASAADASARAAEAQLEQQQVELGFYRVTAPFDGVVGNIPVKTGDYVTQQVALTHVDQSQALELSVSVPPERAAEVKTGSTMVEVLDTEGKPVVRAPIFFVAPTPNPSTQLVELKAVFDNDVGLRAGQVVHVQVVYAIRESLRLPTYAVSQQSSQFFATVVTQADGGGTVAQRVPIQLGQIQNNYYEVLGGLKEGTPVVVGSLQAIRDGQPVQPKPARLREEESGIGGASDAGTEAPRDAGTDASMDGGR